MGLPKLWVETLDRLDALESRVGRLELDESFPTGEGSQNLTSKISGSQKPKLKSEPESEPKPE